MQRSVTLTIGIPTYNRGEAVSRRVREFIELQAPEGVELLIIDNASTDGTYESLTSEFSRSGIRVLQNSKNLGYAGNFLRILEEAKTDYVMVVSDEDRVNFDGLSLLLEFCAEHSPNMVSPRAQVGTKVNYRGRTQTRSIEPDEFEVAAFYVSGLTYDVSVARDYALVVSQLVSTNSAANIYPQVLISALAVAAGGAYFVDALVSTQLEQLQTHIVEDNGDAYFTVSGRWAQFVGYEQFFDRDFDALLGAEGRSRLEVMRNKRREVLLNQLERAAVGEFPGLKEHFLRGRSAKVGKNPISRILGR